MKFRTTCSHCQTIFLLTAEQLEVAQGWAQCSVCGEAFNARSTLASENGDPLPAEVVQPVIEDVFNPESVMPLSEAVTEASPSEIAEPNTFAAPGMATPAIEDAPVTQLSGIEGRAGGHDLTSIILIDPDAEAIDDYGPLPVFSATSTIAGGTHQAASIYGPSYSAPAPGVKSAKPIFTPPAYVDPPKKHAREQRHPNRMAKSLWVVTSLVLVLILLLQLAYFLRDVIALKVPASRPWLERACTTLGCSLGLPRDAALIQIIGSDLQAEPAGKGQLQLKLTLGNRAPYAQAWPMIVLTLTNARDQPQARRSFAPSEYLADPKLLGLGIPAQSEHPLSLPLEIRNLPMAGYHLELAY